MHQYQTINGEWDDWQLTSELEAMADLADAVPLCPRCLDEVGDFDHYCTRCGYAVGRLTPNIPFVNIPFLCEPFCIMWQRLWSPRGETAGRRALYAAMIVVAAFSSGFTWILLVAISLWWLRPQYAPGLCQKCGYDLCKSSDRCPECGTAIEPQSSRQSAAPL